MAANSGDDTEYSPVGFEQATIMAGVSNGLINTKRHLFVNTFIKELAHAVQQPIVTELFDQNEQFCAAERAGSLMHEQLIHVHDAKVAVSAKVRACRMIVARQSDMYLQSGVLLLWASDATDTRTVDQAQPLFPSSAAAPKGVPDSWSLVTTAAVIDQQIQLFTQQNERLTQLDTALKNIEKVTLRDTLGDDVFKAAITTIRHLFDECATADTQSATDGNSIKQSRQASFTLIHSEWSKLAALFDEREALFLLLDDAKGELSTSINAVELNSIHTDAFKQYALSQTQPKSKQALCIQACVFMYKRTSNVQNGEDRKYYILIAAFMWVAFSKQHDTKEAVLDTCDRMMRIRNTQAFKADQEQATKHLRALTLSKSSIHAGNGMAASGKQNRVPSDTLDRQRRDAVWSDAVRELAISGDRLYAFARQMAGAVHEDISGIAALDSTSDERAARTYAQQMQTIQQQETKYQQQMIQAVVGALLKDSPLSLRVAQDATQAMCVVNTESVEKMKRLAAGETGLPFFAAATELERLHEKSKESPATLETVLQQLRDVLQTGASERLRSVQSGEATLRADMQYLSAPRVCYVMRLRNESYSAIRTAFDSFCAEWEYSRHRQLSAWELLEGPDSALCNAFAAVCAYHMTHSRLFSSASAAYVSVSTAKANVLQLRVALTRCMAAAERYVKRYAVSPLPNPKRYAVSPLPNPSSARAVRLRTN